jgi:hypothetical protein
MRLRLIQHCIQHLTNIAAAPRQLRPLPLNRLSFVKGSHSHSQHLSAMEFQNGQNEAAPTPVAVPITSTTPATTTNDTPSAIADVATSADDASEPPKLSKNQQKKLLRKQKFEASREAWKAAKKEKEKARKQRKREAAAAENALKRKLSEDGEEVDSQAEVKRVKTQPIVENITLLMDCGFDDLMNDKVGASSCPRPHVIEGRVC